jgi:uncharacterized BrkB/YihY/UPF0761 family membrane protein
VDFFMFCFVLLLFLFFISLLLLFGGHLNFSDERKRLGPELLGLREEDWGLDL